MRSGPRILVFIPMYQCQQQIGRVLGRFGEEAQSWVHEIVAIDNGSKDNTVQAAQDALSQLKVPSRVLRNDENYSLGGSHKVAFNDAVANGFDYVVVLHGDDQADINDLIPLLRSGEHLKHDALLGSRFMSGSKLVGYSRFRTLGNHVFNGLFSVAARTRIHDLGSGLNLYSTRVLQTPFYQDFPNALTFNNYLLLAGIYRKWNFAFFPLTWREEDQRSNVKMVRQSLQTLRIAAEYLVAPGALLSKDHSQRQGRPYTSTEVARIEGGAVQPQRVAVGHSP